MNPKNKERFDAELKDILHTLKEQKLRKRLTLNFLADVLRVSRYTVCAWLNRKHSPNPFNRRRIAKLNKKLQEGFLV